MALPATFSQFSSAMPAAMNTAPHTGGVMVDSSANQNTNRWAVSSGRPSSVSAGPATETQMT